MHRALPCLPVWRERIPLSFPRNSSEHLDFEIVGTPPYPLMTYLPYKWWHLQLERPSGPFQQISNSVYLRRRKGRLSLGVFQAVLKAERLREKWHRLKRSYRWL